jgi:hypothetical protein
MAGLVPAIHVFGCRMFGKAWTPAFDQPSVLIDGEFRIVRVYGDTGNVLRLPTGQPSDNLLKLGAPARPRFARRLGTGS